jgi:ArsR family transcriptional regulator, arsenate/arsenite/antimonite-responsive transcriptional repressor
MDMNQALRVFGALSDESRVRMLYALRHGELCVCQLIELMGLSPSTVSKHLSILRDAGLLDSRKEGRWVYYRVADETIFPILGKQALPFFQSLEKSATVKADDKHLKQILKMDMEDVCRRIMQR